MLAEGRIVLRSVCIMRFQEEIRLRDLFGFKQRKTTMEVHIGKRLDLSHLMGFTCGAFEPSSLGVCS